jgi:hypothetical protein
MAFSDWDITGSNALSTETAELHSALSSPLSGSGDYCRRLKVPLAVDRYLTITVDELAMSGSFYNVQNTTALQLKSAMRLRDAGNNWRGLWLGCKMSSKAIPALASAAPAQGYYFGISTLQNSSCHFSMYTPSGEVNLGAALQNTWYVMRLQVFPIGASADQVVCSVETSPGSGTWTTLYNNTISSVSSSYVSWGGNKFNGIFLLNGTVSGDTDQIGYIDSIDFISSPSPS